MKTTFYRIASTLLILVIYVILHVFGDADFNFSTEQWKIQDATIFKMADKIISEIYFFDPVVHHLWS